MRFLIVLFLLLTAYHFSFAQHKKSAGKNLVYVDKQGVLRWTEGNKEASFFGVNYTVPFAYGYRSVKALGLDPQTAIDNDVYHLARLGFNAFRVHMWDNEITDSAGNLKEAEHLRLFDYLIAKLKERNIKIFLTPLAYWRGGYPEPEPNTGAFSSLYDKRQVLVTEAAIKAQENYLQQLLKHANPYTKQTYGADPDVIAIEINNEPHHSGTKQQASEYISRMVTAVKSSSWNKPVFYNISESPAYADVVVQSEIVGVSFQWYPTGLVANRSLKGNYLPNVDLYKIPFGDTIPQYRNKARMVYEFDAADVLESYMYPAMARSFRSAGFQWATQFAYDPMATAYGNTEYQTHYVNLAYTPSKAISLLIAGKVFHQVPRLKSYGTYPVDSVFDVFRVSYKNSLSEMNTAQEFYYSNNTATKPIDATKLQHIAGVGSSPIVNYKGYGAYFLDKLEEGVWRLEVMPDAIHIRDPFEKASPQKEVTCIQWQTQPIQLLLPDLGTGFSVKGLNEGNAFSTTAIAGSFSVQPGVYMVIKKDKAASRWTAQSKMGTIELAEFVAPKPFNTAPYVAHQPFTEVTAAKAFSIAARVVGVDSADKATVELRNAANQWKTLPLQRTTAYDYSAEVPTEMVTPGLLNYRIIIQKKDSFYVFPGNHIGNPYAWDAYINESWQTFVAADKAPVELFNATQDRNTISIYNPDWRNNTIEFITADQPRQLVLKATMNKPATGQLMGWHTYFADRIEGRVTELGTCNKLVVKARKENQTPVKARIALINKDGVAFGATITLNNELQEIEIPLSELKQDSALLLPRPYPGFLPLWFKAGTTAAFNITDAEKLQITFGAESTNATPFNIQVQSVWLKQ